MRISTLYATQSSIDAISERDAAIQRAQQQISTGRRVETPSDDPQAAAAAERARAELAHIDRERRAMGFARSILGHADGALAEVTETLTASREQLIAAGNAALGPPERSLIAGELQGLRQRLFAAANSSDGAGGFIFGGQGATSAPFVDNGQVSFVGTGGRQLIASDVPLTTSLDGRTTFVDIDSGNPSNPRENVFEKLDTAIAVLRDANASPQTIQDAIKAAIDTLDHASTDTANKRAEVGEQLHRIDGEESRLGGTEDQTHSFVADLVGADLAKAISEFNALQTNQTAAMKTYRQISSTNLFDYI